MKSEHDFRVLTLTMKITITIIIIKKNNNKIIKSNEKVSFRLVARRGSDS